MIAAGFGFRKEATPDSLQDAYARARQSAQVDVLATVDDKAHTTVFCDFAAAQGVAARPIPGDLLRDQTPTTQSAASYKTYGTGSVAEAAALAAAGPGARLITTRQTSADRLATCALAIRETQ
ncbi:cobalamin biosynthesis protein [Roseobacter sp.]|uniref:cobalamin biosynthesis protein n=1 Tax=Roseobacter sp. TaxID=1907202 RepID=UPI003297E8A0